MRRVTLVMIGMAVTALLVALAGNSRPAHALTVVPQGFTQTYVVSQPYLDSRAFDLPRDMEFAPDGRLFVAQQGGIVKILNPDRAVSTFLDISHKICNNNYMGLLGIALDPQFATNRYVYLFYTTKAEDTNGDGVIDIPMHNRIVRVTVNSSGDSAVPGNEELHLRLDDLVDNGLHNGGDGGLGIDATYFSGSSAAITAAVAGSKATGEGSDTLTGIENLVGSSKNDTLTGSEANNFINGGTLGDSIPAMGGADLLTGAGGPNWVNSQDGAKGNDSLDSGAGTDTKVTDDTEKSIVGFP